MIRALMPLGNMGLGVWLALGPPIMDQNGLERAVFSRDNISVGLSLSPAPGGMILYAHWGANVRACRHLYYTHVKSHVKVDYLPIASHGSRVLRNQRL